MKKVLSVFCISLLVWSCQTESIEEAGLTVADLKMEKVSVCHYSDEDDSYQTITINGNALAAHLAHGDVQLIDEDGDGFVTFENGCSIPVDCDDTDAEFTDNCSVFDNLVGPYAGLVTPETFGIGKGTWYIDYQSVNHDDLNLYNKCDGDFSLISLRIYNKNTSNESYYYIYSFNSSWYGEYISFEEYSVYREEVLQIAQELGVTENSCN